MEIDYRKEVLNFIKKQNEKINLVKKVYDNKNSKMAKQKYTILLSELYSLIKTLRVVGDYKKDYAKVIKNLTKIKELSDNHSLWMGAYEDITQLRVFEEEHVEDFNLVKDYYNELNPATKEHYEELKKSIFKQTFYNRAKNIDIKTQADYAEYVKLLTSGLYAREGNSIYELAALLAIFGEDAGVENFAMNGLQLVDKAKPRISAEALVHCAKHYSYTEDPYDIYFNFTPEDEGYGTNTYTTVYPNKTSKKGVFATNPKDLPISLDDKINHKTSDEKLTKEAKKYLNSKNTPQLYVNGRYVEKALAEQTRKEDERNREIRNNEVRIKLKHGPMIMV